MSQTDYILNFPQLEREISCRPDESLFHSARRHGVRIVAACGGRGSCGSCIVRVAKGEVELVSATNDAPVKPHDHRKWHRACHLRALSDCTLEVAPRSLAKVVRAEDEGAEKEFLSVDPMIERYDAELPLATLDDTRADLDRLAHSHGVDNTRVDLLAARSLPELLREEANAPHWPVRAWLRDHEWIAFGRDDDPSLGLAIDLGTTNVAAFLIDLESGERLASLGVENPQTAWGADVISRVNEAIREPQNAVDIREAIVEAINALAHDLCQSGGFDRRHILDVAICGNTAMHHLLLGLPVRQLGRAPFVAAQRDSLDIKARDLGIHVAEGGWVHLAPNVGGFIGGDHVTALLASENLWQGGASTLVMDIGTNTEISLIHDGKIYSASAPSGPALEGGHIECGMRAADGAVERVRLDGDDLRVESIGRGKAVGVCGSGVLDALAVCYRGGLINAQGRIGRGHAAISEQDRKRRIDLAPEVFINQHDVRAVQLAKAAIRTASDLLLELAGLEWYRLQSFVIAGAFGSYIDIDSGIAIGLFPALDKQRFHQVGNAAGLGIRRMLVSAAERRHARELAARCQYLELNTRDDFQKRFLDNIGFPAVDQASTAARTPL